MRQPNSNPNIEFLSAGDVHDHVIFGLSKIGIKSKQRRNTGKIIFSILWSIIDSSSFLIAHLFGLLRDYDSILIAPEASLKVDQQGRCYVTKFKYLNDERKILVLYRSMRTGIVLRGNNCYNISFIYSVLLFFGSTVSFLRKTNGKDYIIALVAKFFIIVLNGKKNLFVSDWVNYWSLGAISAAKVGSILSSELQHGNIHSNHPAYSFSHTSIRHFACDYLLYWYLPMDTFFLDCLYSKRRRIKVTPKPMVSDDSSKNNSILITLQDSNAEAFLRSLSRCIGEVPSNYQVIIKPRRNPSGVIRTICKNFGYVISSESSFCELVSKCCIHISHSSTTLIEAPNYTTRNLSFDFDGQATIRNPSLIEMQKHSQVNILDENQLGIFMKEFFGGPRNSFD